MWIDLALFFFFLLLFLSSILCPQVPLDMLLLQCNVPVDIQEIEKSTAVISYSPPDPKVIHGGNIILFIFIFIY